MILDKYPKTYRIPIHKYSSSLGYTELPGKFYMEKEDADRLMGSGRKIVREKLDGKAEYLTTDTLQVFYEDLERTHIIPYTRLPAFKIVFMVWKILEERWLKLSEVLKFEKEHGWHTPPIISIKNDPISIGALIELAREPSAFNPDHPKEGIVIMNEDQGIEGKIINPGYDEAFDLLESMKLPEIMPRFNKLREG